MIGPVLGPEGNVMEMGPGGVIAPPGLRSCLRPSGHRLPTLQLPEALWTLPARPPGPRVLHCPWPLSLLSSGQERQQREILSPAPPLPSPVPRAFSPVPRVGGPTQGTAHTPLMHHPHRPRQGLPPASSSFHVYPITAIRGPCLHGNQPSLPPLLPRME